MAETFAPGVSVSAVVRRYRWARPDA
ncbi:MAG: hypothetical protein MRY74_14550 [Neomegalonema sp.]|nr:hypothetical protein [Neomegalonema sp.]